MKNEVTALALFQSVATKRVKNEAQPNSSFFIKISTKACRQSLLPPHLPSGASPYCY